ncbi:DUF2971 domain-containing protein [Terriglobus roseus]|uniref:DUF2971 domain-containing protein n=1 Tax=Terriglobus roseus TaxID=392734 RepID=A0A1G7G5I7_9BACT|nr:DUF2971 domain-containing protein [Terriglobus roseus]SDE83373.1 Protein of unknown function [Terriglobus roseus]
MDEEATSLPEVVYHYTSMETLLKIVESRSIWATCIDYLNDVTEYSFYLEQVDRRLREFVKNGDSQSAFFESYLKGRTGMGSGIIRRRPFVASFSAEPDFLPQWRSYCPNGNGVCIGFRTNCLVRACFSDNEVVRELNRPFHDVRFKQVVYGVSDDRRLDEELREFLSAAADFDNQIKNKLGLDVIFQSILGFRASAQKHPAFKPEAEYRIVVDGLLDNSENLVRYRASRTTLVPYIKLNLPKKAIESIPLYESISELRSRDFIHRVIVGPTPNMSLSTGALRSYFSGLGMSVNVEGSKVPYRDW